MADTIDEEAREGGIDTHGAAGEGRRAVDVAGQTRVVLDADARMPVGGLRERAVAGDDAIGSRASRTFPQDARKILVMMQPSSRGQDRQQEHAADELASEAQGGRHSGWRVREARTAVKSGGFL